MDVNDYLDSKLGWIKPKPVLEEVFYPVLETISKPVCRTWVPVQDAGQDTF